MKKVIILIGNYGSGKTEIALNMAVMAAAEGKRVQVIDLDRINDYFRMSDHVKLLEESNIALVSPTFVGAGITQTNMPAAVGSAFAQDWDLVVFDVGGDPAGALSLARYHMDFAALEPGQLEVYDIINVRRPMSETPEKILKLKGEMEGFARQTVTGFINNSNLQAWASAADLRDGYPIVKAASDPLNKVGSITMYGDGNSTKLVKDVMTTVNQISEYTVCHGKKLDSRRFPPVRITRSMSGTPAVSRYCSKTDSVSASGFAAPDLTSSAYFLTARRISSRPP